MWLGSRNEKDPNKLHHCRLQVLAVGSWDSFGSWDGFETIEMDWAMKMRDDLDVLENVPQQPTILP